MWCAAPALGGAASKNCVGCTNQHTMSTGAPPTTTWQGAPPNTTCHAPPNTPCQGWASDLLREGFSGRIPEMQCRALNLRHPTERDFFIGNLLVRIRLIIEMILEYWPCAMGVWIPLSRPNTTCRGRHSSQHAKVRRPPCNTRISRLFGYPVTSIHHLATVQACVVFETIIIA